MRKRSAICGSDFLETGRTLGNLGLGRLDKAGLKALLAEGLP